jgi:uroporphyrin-III C-methyltransferase/precorrin-2 dehydrogenase/sirohydrochlorin ferrochelatase
MSSFPIFVELGGVAPLVVGGGELAAAKVRLLLKRAQRVAVAADRLVPELAALEAKGTIERLEAGPGVDRIRGRPLVISATGDGEEDARVSALARSLGVPVNVPDRPELCSFILGAIVDRGAVTVAIGTEGAAPVLATRLRAILERELHPRLGRLAQVAASYRDAVARRLPAGAARRAFWERVFGGPAGQAILDGREADGHELISGLLDDPNRQTRIAGRVILIGAGPGDPELLTLKAVRALKSADAILYDNLIGEGVLDHARREATLISVGKGKGRHSRSQGEINALMVALAREGKTVVRLKGGDPFIFGRGGEEVETLRASGIPVEVVPGITAATAAAASLKIPLTHRDLSRSVTFISGHAADGAAEFDQVDFRSLGSAGGATLAVYMGVSTAQALGQQLMAAGWSPATPVIAVERASQGTERRVATSLDVLATETDRLKLAGPAIILVGEVAGLDPAGAVERISAELSRTADSTEAALA